MENKMQERHHLLAEYHYELRTIDKGYTNRTLYINVGDQTIKEKPVTNFMKDTFIGGRGFGLWYLWNAVKPETKWNDPENEIVVGTGPVCGITQYPGTGKSLVVSLSPLTNLPFDSNVGGYFGPLLKFSGFDALELQGKAEKDVIIVIDGNNGVVTIEKAPEEAVDGHLLAELLTEMYAESEDDKCNVSVITAGAGAENTLIGCLNFTFYDKRRKTVRLKQAGRGGLGTVFRDKKIKGIVVHFTGVKGNLNNVDNIALINQTGVKLHKEIAQYDQVQNRMRQIGTANIIEVMDNYDLLPVHNYKFGSHPDTNKIASNVFIEKYITQNLPDGCWYGCSLSCAKAADGFAIKTGPYKGNKVCVDGPEYENAAGLGSNCGIFDPEYILEANFYCDTYGIDTISVGTIIAFVMDCYTRGFINKEITGGLELDFGNADAAMELIHQMARGEGFGKIAGQGVHRMKKIFAEEFGADPVLLQDIGMEQKGLEYSEYLMKESLAQQGGYGLCNKGPQHDEAWLIFMDMVNNQIPTFEDKAEALHYFPMFRTWFGLLGLCKLPWNDIIPPNNKYTSEPAKIPEHVQNYFDLYEGVTGIKLDESVMIRQSEKVYNFQRVFNLRMGSGKRVNDQVPYRSLGPATAEEYESRMERYDKQLTELVGFDTKDKTTQEKLTVMRKYRQDQYEQLVDAVYKRRGWTNDGVPSIEKLQELGIDFPEVVEVIKNHLS
ncbi:MAG: aldehyde ferredoxin oxidoreductase family protein [Bacillota bacterium]